MFTLHCPPRYPDYSNDENFFVEASGSGLQLWCNALNEYLLDTDGHLSLSAILNKGLSLYSAADARARSRDVSMSSNMNDDEEDYEDMADMDEDDDDGCGQGEDDQLEDILDNDLAWELEIAKRKKRWRQKESQIRAKQSAEGSSNEDKTLQQLYHDTSFKSRQPKQVFTDAGASGILTNDLISIMESTSLTGIDADTIDDNIFQWNVKLQHFTSSSSLLERDLQELKKRFGYDYIELQLEFSMDRYPFYPPLVKVIRPRLQGSMMLRVTDMEILKLSYWNPAKDMKTILADIKAFLQTWARLDFTSERNDRSKYPGGAYIDIEHHLLKLALVSELAPRANKKYVTTPPPPANLPLSALETTSSGGGASTSKAGGSHDLHPAFGMGAVGVSSATLVTHSSGSSSGGSKKDNKDDLAPKKGKSKFSIFGMNKDKDGEDKEKKKKEIPLPKNMAKGVGYSRYQQKGWDVKAYMLAQKEKDKQIELVLGDIHLELKKLHGAGGAQNLGGKASNLPDVVDGAGCSSSTMACAAASSPQHPSSSDLPAVEVDSRMGSGKDRGGSRRKRKHSPDEAVASNAVGATASNASASAVTSEPASPSAIAADPADPAPIDPLNDLYAVLEGSALVPFLESKLQANSFLEICNHSSVYKCVINIIHEIACQPCLVSLLGPLPDQKASIHSLLLSLESQARILLDKIGKSSANGSVPKSGKAHADKVADKTSDDKLAK